MYSGFSERTFEFCYNSEFCRVNAAILATHPSIPSQNEEKDLGYDVEFRLRQLGSVRSLFLQHKIVHFAEQRAGQNARFYNAHGGPYYRFPVDSDQHNVLYALANNRGNAFYCAPTFNRTIDLRQAFETSSICRHSLWLNPLEVGPITDHEKHNITFSPNGGNRFLHSDIRTFNSNTRGDTGREFLKEIVISEQYIDELAHDLLERSKKSKRYIDIDREVKYRRPVRIVQQILAKVYDVSWIIIPDL
ncbi:hypothetical protein ACSBLW_18580 [Thioclava sp. FR2]|uniref:hypothetical protein n=1 Tax=Thioclava sp. FR2 TaxID=3445780 RepID=UPI003EBF69DC